mmetsp:Transcript_7702/g.13987  ORF Transcript_7702/g.13987 Transcript_7702/m.13987 type:complete len:186 (-) Transcript_7702:821-1378(-)
MAYDLILKLITLSLLKKASVFLIARTYGFPRLYRRIMQMNRYLFQKDPERRKSIADITKKTFRFPNTVLNKWKSLKSKTNTIQKRQFHTHSQFTLHQKTLHQSSASVQKYTKSVKSHSTSLFSKFGNQKKQFNDSSCSASQFMNQVHSIKDSRNRSDWLSNKYRSLSISISSSFSKKCGLLDALK